MDNRAEHAESTSFSSSLSARDASSTSGCAIGASSFSSSSSTVADASIFRIASLSSNTETSLRAGFAAAGTPGQFAPPFEHYSTINLEDDSLISNNVDADARPSVLRPPPDPYDPRGILPPRVRKPRRQLFCCSITILPMIIFASLACIATFTYPLFQIGCGFLSVGFALMVMVVVYTGKHPIESENRRDWLYALLTFWGLLLSLLALALLGVSIYLLVAGSMAYLRYSDNIKSWPPHIPEILPPPNAVTTINDLNRWTNGITNNILVYYGFQEPNEVVDEADNRRLRRENSQGQNRKTVGDDFVANSTTLTYASPSSFLPFSFPSSHSSFTSSPSTFLTSLLPFSSSSFSSSPSFSRPSIPSSSALLTTESRLAAHSRRRLIGPPPEIPIWPATILDRREGMPRYLPTIPSNVNLKFAKHLGGAFNEYGLLCRFTNIHNILFHPWPRRCEACLLERDYFLTVKSLYDPAGTADQQEQAAKDYDTCMYMTIYTSVILSRHYFGYVWLVLVVLIAMVLLLLSFCCFPFWLKAGIKATIALWRYKRFMRPDPPPLDEEVT